MNGLVIWKGKSPLTNQDIVAIITGVAKPSANTKTGDMLQLWIINEDIHPFEAIQNGDNKAICGNCPHAKGSCYVGMHGVGTIFKSYKSGNYKYLGRKETLSHLKHVIKFRKCGIRFGAYGDPALLPLTLLKQLSKITTGKSVGYTHQWRDFPETKPYLMASVDTESEYFEATSQGWRTFRVMLPSDEIISNEIFCPADKIMYGSQLTTCENCKLCSGNGIKAKNIAILVHGNGNEKKFEKWRVMEV